MTAPDWKTLTNHSFMHIITLDQSRRYAGHILFPNQEYLAYDNNAAELLSRGNCALNVADPDKLPDFDSRQDWNDKSILFVRPGGYGDLLFLTPVINEIHRRWPRARVFVSAFRDYYNGVFGACANVHGEAYPILVSAALEYDAVIWLENYIEGNPAAQSLHVVDLLERRLKMPIADKRLTIALSERWIVDFHVKQPGVTRIGIQVSASSPVRTYPKAQMQILVSQLLTKGYEVYLFGAPGEVMCAPQNNLVNLTEQNLSFQQSLAIMQFCDGFIAPDSSLCHAAGALNIPTVALYGSFPSKLRTKYAASIHPIDGERACAPCFHHSSHAHVFPSNMPCSIEQECLVLKSITPQEIIKTLESIL